ncbi:Hypothetical_protein [Hexamita inflata]|uniref:Hypothetical_protein n=1 Tax=Hexamita inflata TaxID=28002 RepID=A0AA86RFS6_9EUKA|nr:Hypothetical protein HINF_LOCUS65374 [Hexamita inflata]
MHPNPPTQHSGISQKPHIVLYAADRGSRSGGKQVNPMYQLGRYLQLSCQSRSKLAPVQIAEISRLQLDVVILNQRYAGLNNVAQIRIQSKVSIQIGCPSGVISEARTRSTIVDAVFLVQRCPAFGHEMQIDLGHVREISFLVVSYDNDQAVQYTCQYTISEKLYLDILTNKFCVVSLRFSQYIVQYTVLRYCL